MKRPLLPLRAALALALLCAACRSGGGGSSGNQAAGKPPGGTTSLADYGLTWMWQAPPPASVGMPAADDHEVAFTYGHEHLVLLDAKGEPRWDVARLGLRDVAPRLTADLVLAATDDGLAAFRRSDGTKVLDTALQARPNTPVVVGTTAATSTWEGDLVGLEMDTGKVLWRVPLGGAAIGPPATDGVAAFVTWQESHGAAAGAVAVDVATGRRRWAVPLPPGGVSAPAVTPNGSVVVVAGDIAAHALASATGKERWSTDLEGAGSPEVPPVAVGADLVLTAHRLGGLDLLDAATGERRWQVRTDGAMVRGGPVVGPSGSFAFPLDDGRLVLAGPNRATEFRQSPNRISGLAVGPGADLVAAIRNAAANTIQATPLW